jgi:hypothetical protein
MTLITLQDGRLVLRDGQVGTEQACCCDTCAPCPDLESLCISVSLTDYEGTTHTADQDDFIWSGGSGFVYLKGFEYALFVSCNGDIDVTVGWGSFLAECGGQCTSGEGSGTLPCSQDADWYVGTISGLILFAEVCDPGCPENLGTFSVTFSDPPC